LSGKTFKGIISRPDIAKAYRHGFSKAPVSDYMNTEVETVTPAAPFGRIEEIMVGRGQRFLPVVERGQLKGIITRTDYLRSLKREAARRPPFGYEYRLPSRGVSRRDLSEMIEEKLPDRTKKMLRLIGREGDRAEVPVYLVGGGVRDLLLGEENFDLDVMVEGDGISFARRLGKVFGGRVNPYKRFETAVVVLPDGDKIDVATARAEFYESPGAFPKVEHGTVKMDLFRRDFTINALALQLNAPRFGTLHDFFGGLKDLEDGMIRVLHNLSFVEDPTRVFRAIRFETRLKFQLGEVTHRLIKDAVKKDLLGHIVGRRLNSELSLILREQNPLPALGRMEELGVLRYIHPQIHVSRRVHRMFRELREKIDLVPVPEQARVDLFLAALSEDLGAVEREELTDRLVLAPRRAERIHTLVRDGRAAQRLAEKNAALSPGDLFVKLEAFPRETIIYAWARTSKQAAAEGLERLLTSSRRMRTALRGKDLREMGYPPGPAYRRMLGALLKEKINGAAMDRDSERAWLMKHYPPAGAAPAPESAR
jgi:tRNA nucleotidyltransferase (CCA-adding enzyme)